MRWVGARGLGAIVAAESVVLEVPMFCGVKQLQLFTTQLFITLVCGVASDRYRRIPQVDSRRETFIFKNM